MAVGDRNAARACRPAGRRRHPGRLASAALLLLVAAAAPAAATSRLAPLFAQTDRERFEALVNGSDVVCEARLDSTYYGGARWSFLEEPVTWKGDSMPARFKVAGWQRGDETELDVPIPGQWYRLFLWRARAERSGDHLDREPLPWYAVIAAGRAADPPWWWSYSRATVDTIVARARLDTLYAQSPLVLLAHRARVEMHERDGRPVGSDILRVDRVLKGAAGADTIVYQAPYLLQWRDRTLLFLKPHGAGAWEPVWPGAGVFEFDGENREMRTREPLESFLETLDRLAERAAKH